MTRPNVTETRCFCGEHSARTYRNEKPTFHEVLMSDPLPWRNGNRDVEYGPNDVVWNGTGQGVVSRPGPALGDLIAMLGSIVKELAEQERGGPVNIHDYELHVLPRGELEQLRTDASKYGEQILLTREKMGEAHELRERLVSVQSKRESEVAHLHRVCKHQEQLIADIKPMIVFMRNCIEQYEREEKEATKS